MTLLPLRHDTLEHLPTSAARPSYPLQARTAGIVHLGFGGFHRAHMARYTHDLMQQGEALGWGIVGAGLLPPDRAVAAALAPQDGLYTLVERSADEDTAAVIGSVCEALYAGDATADLLGRMDRVRLVSLTVTEAGYGLNAATKQLDPQLEPIAGDLANPHAPRTPVGILVEALRRRRCDGRAAFTALSCDNIQHNGQVLRGAVLDYADRLDPGLAGWIACEARFPNTMVDRITPAPTPDDKTLVASSFGIQDRWPVVAEDFRQWVIEDDFADGRPDWDHVGAQFVADVAPYELMKLRLLNTSHLAICGLGRLMGYTYVDEAMRDGRLARYMRALMDRETGPTLPIIPGIDLDRYKAKLAARFANPKILDTVERVNTDAPLNYLLDPLRDRLASGGSIDLLTLGLAAWMRRVLGQDETGVTISVRHPLADELRRRALIGRADPRPLFALESLFGDLAQHERLVTATARRLDAIYEHGVGRALDQALAELDI